MPARVARGPTAGPSGSGSSAAGAGSRSASPARSCCCCSWAVAVAGRRRRRRRRPPTGRPPASCRAAGATILPRYRVVAYYGAPQDDGAGRARHRHARRRRRASCSRSARALRGRARPVLPAFELIATLAQSAPGDDGLHRLRQTDAVIRRYLRAVRARQGAADPRHPAGAGRLHGGGAGARAATCASRTWAWRSTPSGACPTESQPGKRDRLDRTRRP